MERYNKEKDLPLLDKTKFLVPEELTMSQFVTIIRSLPIQPVMKHTFTSCMSNGLLAKQTHTHTLALLHSLSNTSCFSPSRNRMGLSSTQAFYLLVNNKSLASMSMTMSQIYDQELDEDGFLYMVYASHEFFG